MDKKSIIYWRKKYDKEEDLYTKGVEEELRVKFQKNKYMTKDDLKRIVKWKFQGKLEGRQKRILKLLENVDGKFIKKISRLAFETKNDKDRIKLFCIIEGIGPAVASVILTFYDPKNYGVFDIHTWDELFGERPKDLFSNINHLLHFFVKLGEISHEVDLPCRDIEKSLFKKNKDRG